MTVDQSELEPVRLESGLLDPGLLDPGVQGPGVLGVIGLGATGSGLVEAAARAGLAVIALEPGEGRLDQGRARVRRLLEDSVARDRLPAAESEQVWQRIRFSAHWPDLAAADLVAEAVPERHQAKADALRRADQVCTPGTVLATSASALSVTALAAATGRPARVVGLHLFVPVADTGVAEVVRTVMTEPAALDRVRALVTRLGKTGVVLGDRAGLISTALLFGYLNQSVAMHDQQFADRDDIDAAMRLGCGLPYGPLETLDLIGIDTACDILTALAERLDEPSLAPDRRLRHMALAGLLGRKSGRGFHRYDQDGRRLPEQPSARQDPAGAAEWTRPVGRIGIVGSGTMAAGIAELCVKAGLPTVLAARSPQRAEAARAVMAGSMGRAVARGKLSEQQRDTALALLDPQADLAALADCDLVIEAAAEDLLVKRELFAALGRICKPGAVLATTTSSLPVIECALASGRPQDVLGLHFFNPAPQMRLVEVIPSLETAPEVVATGRALCATLGKHPVRCADRPGFIVNALLFPYLNEAVRMVEAHYADADDIDTVMKLGFGYPLGPFELLDVIGLDVSLSIQQVLHAAAPHPRSVPAPLLGHLVAAGRAGRKAGAGFRVHS
ncbi:3-hydroxyacyl-CoA dehydrogenase family protein [Streptacidiphilus sp. EB129]|uniref:3-hydroxyacyl-CoA dehydrogenase family protein n=1 Tax=Streptacidiphilus sp. EB129 TaxID=3156262 RepID=UPI003518FC49